MKPLTCYAVAALAVSVAIPAIQAAPSCTNGDFAGVYGMQAPGTILSAPGFPAGFLGPFNRVGRVASDGKGNISVTNTASYNGNIIVESYTGTYSIAADCTLDVVALVGIPIGPGGSLVKVPFEFRGALADGGDSAAVLLCGVGAPCIVPTGNVIRVLLTRNGNNQRQCTNRDLSGAFQLDMSGTVVSGPLPGPFARDGRLLLDDNGSFTGTALVNYSGASLHAETIAGSYAVDSLCNVSLTWSDGTLHTWTGTLTDKGNGANLIVSETGVVIAGTLRQQKAGGGSN